MKQGIDWLAWILQGVVGASVGAMIGFALISRRGRGFWFDQDLILQFLVGSALIGISMASLFGDKLWLGNNYRIFPIDAPRTTVFSKALSFLLGGAGLLMAAAAIAKQFKVM
jgi:hypothetical protein